MCGRTPACRRTGNALCSGAMSEAEHVHPGADMERFVREQMAFVGLGEVDIALIRRTAPVVLESV